MVAITAVMIHVIHTRAVDARATAALINVACYNESVGLQQQNAITYVHALCQSYQYVSKTF